MSQKAEFHNLDKPDDGLMRELAAGVVRREISWQGGDVRHRRFYGTQPGKFKIRKVGPLIWARRPPSGWTGAEGRGGC